MVSLEILNIRWTATYHLDYSEKVPEADRPLGMNESADARSILTAVPHSNWKKLTSWLATMKNDVSFHNLSVEDTTELALDRPLWRLLL